MFSDHQRQWWAATLFTLYLTFYIMQLLRGHLTEEEPTVLCLLEPQDLVKNKVHMFQNNLWISTFSYLSWVTLPELVQTFFGRCFLIPETGSGGPYPEVKLREDRTLKLLQPSNKASTCEKNSMIPFAIVKERLAKPKAGNFFRFEFRLWNWFWRNVLSIIFAFVIAVYWILGAVGDEFATVATKNICNAGIGNTQKRGQASRTFNGACHKRQVLWSLEIQRRYIKSRKTFGECTTYNPWLSGSATGGNRRIAKLWGICPIVILAVPFGQEG